MKRGLGVTPRAQPWLWSQDHGAGQVEFLGDRFERLKLERWEWEAKGLLITALVGITVLREGDGTGQLCHTVPFHAMPGHATAWARWGTVS